MATPRERDPGTQLDEWSPRLLKSRLYQRILVDIIIGALAANEQLDENSLAKRYGGGLAGIREALTRLALEGLVVRRARVGTSVAPLDLVGAREAFEARCLIEVHCAGLAAQSASDEEIAGIRATLDNGEEAVRANDQAALAAMDEAFHVAVAAARPAQCTSTRQRASKASRAPARSSGATDVPTRARRTTSPSRARRASASRMPASPPP